MDQSFQVVVPTLKLREKIRDYTKSYREKMRTNCLDSLRFGIGEIKASIQELESLTEKDVTGLAGRIKRRKHATKDDMYRLSHAFLQEEKNIETFSKIPGAMQVLVKEFTGKDSERQFCSAECLCNLSLGQAPVCEKICSLAGSYLVTYLHTKEHQLILLCLWTIANILATSFKGSSILMQMQLLPQLWKLYTDDGVVDDLADCREDAAICLQIIALKSKDLLKSEEREYVLKHIAEKNPTCVAAEYHLQIVFHILFSHPELLNALTPSQQQYLISYSLSNICNTKEFKTDADRLRILYSTRVLGNLMACHHNSYLLLLHQISTNWQTNVIGLLNSLFSFENLYLNREATWLLKNILHIENSMGTNQPSFIQNLRIPKIKSKSNVLIQSDQSMVV